MLKLLQCLHDLHDGISSTKFQVASKALHHPTPSYLSRHTDSAPVYLATVLDNVAWNSSIITESSVGQH